MIDPHADPTLIQGHVIDSFGDDFSQFLVGKVLRPHFLGVPSAVPFPTCIAEIPDQFLLLRVHRHHRLTSLLEGPHLTVDVLKLGVAVGMRTAFPGLAVGLQAVIHVMQQSSHCHMANSVSHPVQFIRQVAGTLAGPEQGRLWVTSSRRFQQDGQVMAQGRVTLFDRMPPTADPTNAFGWPVLGGQVALRL